MQKVTNKNTKNEILDAYEGLLQEVKDNKTNKSEEQKVKTSSQLVTKSLAQNSKDIIHNIAELKLQVNQDLENLGKSLLLEKEKLNNGSSAFLMSKLSTLVINQQIVIA